MVTWSAFHCGRQAHRQEAPGGAHLVVAILHVAGLAGGCGHRVGQGAVLFQERAHAMLGGGVHLPLRVIKSHVASLAGLRLLRLLLAEGVPGMTGITRGVAVSPTCGLQLVDFLARFKTHLVAPAATFHSG
jgi:hypothetical protein